MSSLIKYNQKIIVNQATRICFRKRQNKFKFYCFVKHYYVREG